MAKNDFFNKKILITGGNGFIGSHLTRRLIKEGANVTLIVYPRSSPWRIKDLIPRLKIIEVDIADYRSTRRAISKENPQKIFHLAAHLNKGHSFKDINLTFKINIQGTINLLRALEEVKYDCFLNTGSSEEYGRQPVPFRETQSVSPVSFYSASKSAAFLFCDMYHKIQDRPIVTLRPFVVYGPKQGLNTFIPQLIVSALQKKDFKMSEGKQTRDFIYVTDVVEGYLRAAMSPGAVGEIINLGTGLEYSLIEIAEKIMAIMRNPIRIIPGTLPYRSNEIWRHCCDNVKAKKLLNWKPEVDIDEGLKKTIDWFKKNKNLLRTYGYK